MKELSISLPNNFILAKSISWDTLYKQSDLILYDDNSIGIEGLIYGIKTFYLNIAEPIYNCNRMFNFECWEPSISKKNYYPSKNLLKTGLLINLLTILPLRNLLINIIVQ